jgi:hypothetical protein
MAALLHSVSDEWDQHFKIQVIFPQLVQKLKDDPSWKKARRMAIDVLTLQGLSDAKELDKAAHDKKTKLNERTDAFLHETMDFYRYMEPENFFEAANTNEPTEHVPNALILKIKTDPLNAMKPIHDWFCRQEGDDNFCYSDDRQTIDNDERDTEGWCDECVLL